jgi:hypothetical protein
MEVGGIDNRRKGNPVIVKDMAISFSTLVTDFNNTEPAGRENYPY